MCLSRVAAEGQSVDDVRKALEASEKTNLHPLRSGMLDVGIKTRDMNHGFRVYATVLIDRPNANGAEDRQRQATSTALGNHQKTDHWLKAL